MLRGTAIWLLLILSAAFLGLSISSWYILDGPARSRGQWSLYHGILISMLGSLLVSQLGVPVAVAKNRIAKYNTVIDKENTALALIWGFPQVHAVWDWSFSHHVLDGTGFASMSRRWRGWQIPVMQSLSWAVLIFRVYECHSGFFPRV